MISGGGTGGHIYPAISIAQALQVILNDVEILFVGAKGKMEMKKVPEAGFKIVGLWISGIQRKLTLSNLLFPLKVIFSIVKSFSLLRSFKPDAVIGVGGYASGPLLWAATARKIPSLIQEQNSYAGLTNKWLANRVEKICVAHGGMGKYFPEEKLVVTGNPIRAGIKLDDTKKSDAYQFFHLDENKQTILILGGSLGARMINESVLAGFDKLIASGHQIIWQTGGYYFDEMLFRTEGKDLSNIQLKDFVREMQYAYAVADVVVSRAGALSIAELMLTKKASILVPSANVAEDHQTINAEALVEREAALMIPDRQAQDRLVDSALELLENPEQRKVLSTNIGHLAKPEAAKDIANEIIKLTQ